MATLSTDAHMSDTLHAPESHSDEYSYRLPTPPRIVVPPPSLNTGISGVAIDYTQGLNAGLGFLQDMDLEGILQSNALLEWVYERRREAQMVLPWLYLGPMVAVKDKDFLLREGITMVFAVRARQRSMLGAIRTATEAGVEVATVEAATHQGLIRKFPFITKTINAHVAKVHNTSIQNTGQPALGKVLLFCESGNEMSAGAVGAYLIDMLADFDHVKAMQVCQSQRFCVNFDDAGKHALLTYHEIIKAKRAVTDYNSMSHNAALGASATAYQSSSTPSKAKRTAEDMNQAEDVDMSEDAEDFDALRFQGRNSAFRMAPFHADHSVGRARDL